LGRHGVNNKTFQAVTAVTSWCSGGDRPEWVGELKVDDIPLETYAPRSAIYRGILCLSALAGERDFCTGQPMALNDCQDDHIFPKAVYENEHPVDGILNRAFIRREYNSEKRAKRPSLFFELCLEGHGRDETHLLATLGSHLISPYGYQALLTDDFEAFVEQRRASVKQASGSASARVEVRVALTDTPDQTFASVRQWPKAPWVCRLPDRAPRDGRFLLG
jgi:hypothetical protein